MISVTNTGDSAVSYCRYPPAPWHHSYHDCLSQGQDHLRAHGANDILEFEQTAFHGSPCQVQIKQNDDGLTVIQTV